MVEGTTLNVNLSCYVSFIKEAGLEKEALEIPKLFEDDAEIKSVIFYQGLQGDGQISFSLNAGRDIFRISQSGVIVDSNQMQSVSISERSAGLLIASLFSESELSMNLGGGDAIIARAIYSVRSCFEISSQPVGVQCKTALAEVRKTGEAVCEKEVDQMTRLLDAMIAWAIDEDWFPGGIEPDEIRQVISEYNLSVYVDDAYAQRRILREILGKALDTYTGRRYALENEHGQCSHSFTAHRNLGPSFGHSGLGRMGGYDRPQIGFSHHSRQVGRSGWDVEEESFYQCEFEFPHIPYQFQSEYSVSRVEHRDSFTGRDGPHFGGMR